MNFKESWYLGFRDRRDHISQKSVHSRSQFRIGFHPLTINKKIDRVPLSSEGDSRYLLGSLKRTRKIFRTRVARREHACRPMRQASKEEERGKME